MNLGEAIVKIGAENTELKAKINEAERQLGKFEKNTNNSTGAMSKGFGSLGGAIAGAFTVGVLINFGKKVIETIGQFQRLEAVLTNTLGSSSAAKKSMDMIQRFAAKTPFGVADLTESFVKLANQGFKPTANEMRKLGDLASSTGKGFDQLTEAIIDAQTGEFERLKEFGIRASKEGDNVKFTFKGVETQAKFTADSIRNYVLGLGDLQGVSGSMAAISETLEGKISNLGDSFDQFILGLNSGDGAVSSFVGGLIELASSTLEALTPAKSLSDQFFELKKSTDNLVSTMPQLLSRHDELKQKSELSKDEQKELKDIVEKVATTIPSAVTQFDKYGKAMSISTGLARGFISSQQEMLAVKNAEAIEEEVIEINKLNRERLKLKATLEGTAGGYANLRREGNKLLKETIVKDGKQTTSFWVEVENGIALYTQKLQSATSKLRGHVGVYQELTGKVKENNNAVEESNEVTLTDEQTKALEEKRKKLKEIYDEAERINKNLAAGFGLIDDSDLEVDLSNVKVKDAPENIWDFSDMEMPDFYEDLEDDFKKVITKAEEMRSIFVASANAINSAFAAIATEGLATFGAALGTAFAGGDVFAVGMQFASIIADTIGGLGKNLIAIGVTMTGIMDVLKTAGFANPALLIGGGVALIALSSAMKGMMSSPVAFANGGLAFGSTMGMVGEGIGTSRSNPEVIAPLDKLKSFMPQGGGEAMNLRFELEGSKLVAATDRYNKTTKYSR